MNAGSAAIHHDWIGPYHTHRYSWPRISRRWTRALEIQLATVPVGTENIADISAWV
jgi:hypothetical protein